MRPRRFTSSIWYLLSSAFGGAVLPSALVLAQVPKVVAPPQQQAANDQQTAKKPEDTKPGQAIPVGVPQRADTIHLNAVRQAMTEQYRMLVVSDLRFIRAACNLSTVQSTQIAREALPLLTKAVAEFVERIGPVGEGARATSPDQHERVRAGLARVAMAHVSARQWTRYQAETKKRLVHRQKVAIGNSLVKLDRQLSFSAEQRAALSESLACHWNETWVSLEIFLDDQDAFLDIPDQLIVPFLRETQKKIWNGLARYGGECEEYISVVLLRHIARWMAGIPSEFDDVLATRANQQDKAEARPGEGEPERNASQEPQNTLTDEQFNQWVENAGFDRDDGVVAARDWLDSILTLPLDYLDRTCGITEIQKKKLKLAGHADIKRFFDQVEEKRMSFPLLKKSPEEVGQHQLELQQLQGRFGRQLFEDGSIFSKIIPRTLDGEQAAMYQRALRESTLFQHRAHVDRVVEYVDVVVGFRDEQRQRLTQLLCKETRCLPQSGMAGTDLALMLTQVGKLPDARLRPICDDFQWQALSGFLKRVRDDFHPMNNRL